MGFQSFEERAKKDPDYIRRRLEIHGGYDKHGDVFGIARPLPGPVSLSVKTFRDAKTLEQFIDEFTFFRYGGRCPSWYSVLLASECFSGEEKYSYTLKGKNYTPEGGKAYVTQLIASGELVVHYTGSWIPPGDRNHHLPWPKSSTKEEFLPVVHRPYTLGPHEEPDYVPSEKTSTLSGREVIPDKQLSISASTTDNFVDASSELSKRQAALLEQLTQPGTSTVIKKSDVSLNDLAALTKHTGNEFGMFTFGSQRTVIRGYSNDLGLSENQIFDFALSGHRFSGHTHPGITNTVLTPSTGDTNVLRLFNEMDTQRKSVILNSQGDFRVFSSNPFDDMFGF